MKEDERSAEKNFPEIPFNKPLGKMLGVSVLAARIRSSRRFSGQLEEQKGHLGLCCFDLAGRDQSVSGSILSQEDLGLLFVLIGKKGNLGFGLTKNMSKTFTFDTNFTQKESGVAQLLEQISLSDVETSTLPLMILVIKCYCFLLSIILSSFCDLGLNLFCLHSAST